MAGYGKSTGSACCGVCAASAGNTPSVFIDKTRPALGRFGKRAAAIMSPIATAKAKTNGIEPHTWLTDALTRLPVTKDRDTLLPLA